MSEISKYNRKSIRLKKYDYSQTGEYFITICIQNRECLLGKIENHKLILNDAGTMVCNILNDIPKYYTGINIGKFIVMPNHIHAIIIITEKIKSGRTQGSAPTNKLKLSDVVQYSKSLTTKKYIENIKQNNWKSFDKKLWQRNFYEHVVRDEKDLNKIREYIINNYLKWDEDKENPNNIK